MPYQEPSLFLVIDVESVGLYGEGFAVGGVVIDKEGNKQDEFIYACPASAAMGRANQTDIDWVRTNIPPLTYSHTAPWLVRSAFWRFRQQYLAAMLVADCFFPVETSFLGACIADDPNGRTWSGNMYPLFDLSTLLASRGFDPTATYSRLDGEKPNHNPLADARQSARILIELLNNTFKGVIAS